MELTGKVKEQFLDWFLGEHRYHYSTFSGRSVDLDSEFFKFPTTHNVYIITWLDIHHHELLKSVMNGYLCDYFNTGIISMETVWEYSVRDINNILNKEGTITTQTVVDDLPTTEDSAEYIFRRGKWYTVRLKHRNKDIIHTFCFKERLGSRLWFEHGYDFENSRWLENDWVDISHNITRATIEEVEHALIAGARYKGYEGNYIEILTTKKPVKSAHKIIPIEYEYDAEKDWLLAHNQGYHSYTLFYKGKWAKIIKDGN